MNLIKHTLYSVLAIIIISACTSNNSIPNELTPAYAFDSSLEAKVDSIVSILTLDEKIALTHGNGKFWSAGVERLGISDVQYADGPLGVREELGRHSWAAAGWTTDSASFFPAGGGLAATWNIELSGIYGECIGAEARARDKDYLLAPAINIQRTPLNGRNYEYFNEDPYLNVQMTVPYVKGVQSQDVAACVKHYAINNQETNRGRIDVLVDERALREIYLPAFKAAVVEGQAYSMMGAYNKFRGDYLCENDYLLNKILKDEWGFKGTVMSDWGATHSTVQSANSGLDIEMGSGGGDDYSGWFFANPLRDSVASGAVDMSVIDEIAKRNIRVLLNVKKTDSSRSKGAINVEKHRKLMYDVATESIVLLKNSKNVLPIDVSKTGSIAVIGDNAKQKHAAGGFGAGVKVQYEVSPFEGLQNRLPEMTFNYAQGYKKQYDPVEGRQNFQLEPNNTPDAALIAEAVEAAKGSDVAVIFAGTNRLIESESQDRQTMGLPYGQVELIKAVTAVNPNTVVVLICGTAFDLREVDASSSAILWSWFNGSEGGNALADIILGEVNPSGKLPFTIPRKLEDSPAHATNSFPGDTLAVTYKEGILVGYRWFDTKKVAPMFPFGHGLSYTDFEYDEITTDQDTYTFGQDITLSVNLTNMGMVEGKEVVQVYVSDPEASVLRPAQELKAFTKVSLEPGNGTTANISIPTSSFAFYDDKKMDWVLEPGEYQLSVASSSRDIKGSVSITVQ